MRFHSAHLPEKVVIGALAPAVYCRQRGTMRIAILIGVFLGLQGCGSRTGVKKAASDASTEVASQTGAPTSDSGVITADLGAPLDLPSADQASPDATKDVGGYVTEVGSRLDLPTADRGSPDRSADQADGSADSNTVVDLRADQQAGPRETPGAGSFELRTDSPRVVAADAGQCIPGFIRAWTLEFPADAKTVKVNPFSAIRSLPMDGSLSDGSGPVLQYALKDGAGELLVWRQGDAWLGQLTVYGTGPEAGCVRGELVAPPS